MASFGTMFSAQKPVQKKESRPRQDTKWIHYTKLSSHAKQYRNSTTKEDIENLAAAIEAAGGILQNLRVRRIGPDEYEIIAGHHRAMAAKLLVEEKGISDFAFLPCTISESDDVRAEFELYASNAFVPKSDYERMHELKRMKELLEQHPEEFPHLKGGRVVERLAEQMHMKRSTVSEYLSISRNLGDTAMEGFAKGEIKKSAAVELASLPEEEQESLVQSGTTSYREVKEYKERKTASISFQPDMGDGKTVSASQMIHADAQTDASIGQIHASVESVHTSDAEGNLYRNSAHQEVPGEALSATSKTVLHAEAEKLPEQHPEKKVASEENFGPVSGAGDGKETDWVSIGFQESHGVNGMPARPDPETASDLEIARYALGFYEEELASFAHLVNAVGESAVSEADKLCLARERVVITALTLFVKLSGSENSGNR